MKNIYETFDSAQTGRVSNNEILWVFSMAMNGTGGKYLKIVSFVHFQLMKSCNGCSNFMTKTQMVKSYKRRWRTSSSRCVELLKKPKLIIIRSMQKLQKKKGRKR